jgi:hypothetical protein
LRAAAEHAIVMPIQRESDVRAVLASFAGAAVACGLPVLGSLYSVLGPGFVNPDGSPDNAPARGAGLFLLASPFLFVIVWAFFALSILLLHRASRLSCPSLCLVSAATAVGSWGVAMVAMGARQTNVLATLSGGLAVLLLAGSVASWMVLRA